MPHPDVVLNATVLRWQNGVFQIMHEHGKVYYPIQPKVVRVIQNVLDVTALVGEVDGFENLPLKYTKI